MKAPITLVTGPLPDMSIIAIEMHIETGSESFEL